MKRQALYHTKVDALMLLLKLPRWGAVGILESLWHLTAREAPLGDIGRLTDECIARAIDWRSKNPAQLVSMLVQAGWLDLDATHRLLVHGWSEHADGAVIKYVQRKNLQFFCPDKSSHDQTSLPRARALPVPEPEPMPVPEPEPCGKDAAPLCGESPVQHPGPDQEAKGGIQTKAQIDRWTETEFWPLWPLKKGKEEARKAARAINTLEMQAAVMAGLRAQLPGMVRRIQAGEPIKWAQGWLNNKRWEDEPDLFSKPKPTDRYQEKQDQTMRRAAELITRKVTNENQSSGFTGCDRPNGNALLLPE